MKSIHPFPARMAPELALREVARIKASCKVLDPMMGSGTALVSARVKGHEVVGVDRDPLAVLIAQASCRDLNVAAFRKECSRLLKNAKNSARELYGSEAYPRGASEETKAFVRYWFDAGVRKQLASLTNELQDGDYRYKGFLKVAISRMIITKQGGVSLAEDVSHSRPHRTRDLAPLLPFDLLPHSAEAIIRNSQFSCGGNFPIARLLRGDCRSLPFPDGEFDLILTSPPYLSAIDYLRGHKLSLVWFGYDVLKLRQLRSTNIGTERGIDSNQNDAIIDRMVDAPERLSSRLRDRLRLYVSDLRKMILEIRRVLKDSGRVVFVIGDCTLNGIEIRNSRAIELTCRELGLVLTSQLSRPLRSDRRYLPPPTAARLSDNWKRRMWEERILRFRSD